MADAAVEFLLNNLNDLLTHHIGLIVNAKSEVQDLVRALGHLKTFAREVTNKLSEDDRVKGLVKDISDLVHEAEDLVDTFVTSQAAPDAESWSISRLAKKPAKLHSIATDVQAISARIKTICGDKSTIDLALLPLPDGKREVKEVPIVREKNIVGFEEGVEKLIGYLKEEKENDVISIIGMPGLGKTTLAGVIYRDPKIIYEFPTRIWVYISQEFTRKNVFLAILKQLNMVNDATSKKSDQELADTIRDHLGTTRFLMVMDDVWKPDDWDKLNIALPTDNKMGKILITSRLVEVASYTNRDRAPYMLPLLNSDEGWLLLRYEVFGKPDFPSHLKEYGEKIVAKCNGVPLAIVVIGGILVKKVSPSEENTAITRNAWKEVYESVNANIVGEDSTKRMENIIALSYKELPYHLRACFLYLGMFPEDFEIPAWKLTHMWIAEGFIQEKVGISFENTAESYLGMLINRNLLTVEKRRQDGKVKTCRIHDMLRDFCRTESEIEKENFLQEFKKYGEGTFSPSLTDLPKLRRLCIHSNIIDFVSSSKLNGPHVRSFVSFSAEIKMPAALNSTIPKAFKLLRVLEAKPIIFDRISEDVCNLVHLRYIAISFSSNVLPKGFAKLWNLQTLIVETTDSNLEIKADIWNMKQLKHVKTNASTELPKTGTGNSEGENLQTLGTISPKSCTEAVFDKARNVKRLSIGGRLTMFLDKKNGSFDTVGKLSNLEKLKLTNDNSRTSSSARLVWKLPSADKFPPKLRSLTLVTTFLDWTQMSILGLLNLEVLKLKEKAFMGKTWVVSGNGFEKLEVLYISQTNLEEWTVSKQQFPNLTSLELRNCTKLKQVPTVLAELPNFKRLNLHFTKSAAASANEILARKKSLGEGKFKLSISP